VRRRIDALLAALETWWLAERPLQALVAARIVFGGVLFVAYALRIPAYQDLFGPRGIGGPALAAKVPELPALHPSLLPALDLLRQIPDERGITALFALLLVALAAFTLGFATRIAGWIVLGLHLLFWARNPIAYVSWAGFVIAPLLYVVLAPVGRHWSIDAWLRRRRGLAAHSWFGPGWPLRLLQIHVCTMYAASGWSRLDKPSWLAGDTVLIALTSANFSRVAIDWSAVAPLLAFATWASLVLEVLAPALLWVPRVRKLWALGLIGMHAALAVLIHEEIWAWSGVMIGGLLAFLFPDRAAPSTTKG
jgi:hypothetical protein